MLNINETKLNMLISGYSGARFRNITSVSLEVIEQIDNDYQLESSILIELYCTLTKVPNLSEDNGRVIIWLVQNKQVNKLLEPFWNGDTLLHNAAYENNYNLILLLINWFFKAETTTTVNSRNNRGWSVLHAAAIGILKKIELNEQQVDWRVISILLEHGADIKAETNNNYTVADIFKSRDERLAVKFWAVVVEQEEIDALSTFTSGMALHETEMNY